MKNLFLKKKQSFKIKQRESTIQSFIASFLINLSSENNLLIRVSVIRVQLSPDSSNCTVFLHSSLEESSLKECLIFLRSKNKEIRMALAKSVILRRIPLVHFRYDNSINNEFNINKIIDEVLEKDKKIEEKINDK